jgi:hypothetical protein
MKKYFIVIPIILSLGVLSWAQGSKDPFDAKKSEAELEIMKGILSTTLSYVAQNHQKDAWRLNASNMSSFYLIGQGAVFVIPTSKLRSIELTPFLNGRDIKLNLDMSKLDEQTRFVGLFAQKQATDTEKMVAELSKSAIGAGQGSGAGPGIGSGVGPGLAAPPAPPKPPAPPAPLAAPQVDREELRKKVEEYQIEIKKSREEAAANQEKLIESLTGIRVFLIEALANYGDSLTQVKPGEYINLVLCTDSFDSTFGRMKTRHDVISAQKSWITDYKAGRISLDSFKQKALQYTE